MVNPGLTRRLDQHGRRAGIAIGLTMALVAMLLIGGFITIYGRLDPLLSDFIAANVPTEPVPTVPAATEPPADEEGQGAAAPRTEPPNETEPPATATVANTDDEGDEPEPTATAIEDAFEPDYRIASGEGPINFREIPSLLNNEPITSLEPGTPLEYLGEQQDDADNFAENGTWLRFQLADGTEGWVREIDVEQTG